MSLSNVELLKEMIGLNSYEDEWIQTSKISCSPFGDFMAIASPSAVVFYVKKYNNGQDENLPQFQISRTHHPSSDLGPITALHCLPVKVEQGRTHDLWHCVVVGHASGNVQFVTDSGQVLVSKQFVADKPVVQLRSLSQVPSRTSNINALAVPKLEELLIVYECTIVAVDSSVLYGSLLNNKAEAARAKSRGEDFKHLSNLPGRKWHVRDQTVSDVAAFAVPNISFDQLQRVAMNRRLLNEDHLRSLGNLVTYTSVGHSPFIQDNSPHLLMPHNINELAHNVVSTVKSGIFRVASGLIWGSSSEPDAVPEQPKDPEQKLEIRQAFKDHSKEAKCVELSPDKKYSAVIDAHQRVMLLDNNLGTVIHVWKGYHHAQVGWITTLWDAFKANPEKIPPDLELGVLLVLYLPRRGLLEVWSPEQKARIAEFPVGKRGRLVHSSNVVLDTSPRSPFSVRIHSCCFLEPHGAIKHMYIPVHALTNKSSSHDVTVQRQLHSVLLESEDAVKGNLQRITELVLSAKATQGKIRMLIEIFNNSYVDLSDCRHVLEAVTSQLSECPVTQKQCALLRDALDLFEFLTTPTENVGQLEEMSFSCDLLQEVFKCSGPEAECLANLLHRIGATQDVPRNKPVPSMTVAEFMSCFHLHTDGVEQDDTKGLKLNTKHVGQSMKHFYTIVGQAAVRGDYRKTVDELSSKGVNGQALLNILLVGGMTSTLEELFSLSSERFHCLFQLAFDLHLKSDGSFQSLLQQARKTLNKGSLCVETYVTMLYWKTFLTHSQNYSAYFHEWDRVLRLTEAFTVIHNERSSLYGSPDDCSVQDQLYSFEDVYNAGNGRIVEIIVKWLVEAGHKVGYLDDLNDPFMTACVEYFPAGMHKNILAAHMCWEYLHRWSKQHGDLTLLSDGQACLVWVDMTTLQHRLALLAWTTFLSKTVRDAVNLTEIRSASRCERELGLGEAAIAVFLKLACKMLRVLLDTAVSSTDKISVGYDPLCHSSNKLHLVDHLAQVQPCDHDIVAVQYQMAAVATLIWHFGLDLKPLRLFNSQETAMFFQTASSSRGLSIFSAEHSRSVRSSRRKFLEVACDGAVACIHLMPATRDNVELDTKMYHQWMEMVNMLAKMWNMSDKQRELHVVALYRGGQDTLGEELLHTLAERQSVSQKLLRLAMLRLAKYVYESKDQEVKLAAVRSELASKLATLSKEVDTITASSVKATSNLLISISNTDLDDQSQQLVYECLSVTQTFLRSSAK